MKLTRFKLRQMIQEALEDILSEDTDLPTDEEDDEEEDEEDESTEEPPKVGLGLGIMKTPGIPWAEGTKPSRLEEMIKQITREVLAETLV